MDAGVLDIHHGEVIGLVVETQCNYFAPIAFPQAVDAGVRVAQLGRSSVRYEIGLFAGDAPDSAAAGHFVHVYVDRATRRPVPLPEPLKAVLRSWTVAPDRKRTPSTRAASHAATREITKGPRMTASHRLHRPPRLRRHRRPPARPLRRAHARGRGAAAAARADRRAAGLRRRVHHRQREDRRHAAGRLPAAEGRLHDGRRLQQHRRAGLHRARRASSPTRRACSPRPRPTSASR